MTKKIIGAILILIGGVPLILRVTRLIGGGSSPEMSEHMRIAAGHAGIGQGGKLSGGGVDIGLLLIVIPIVFVIVGVVLLTHKEKTVKK